MIDETITGEIIVATAGWCIDDAVTLLPKAAPAALRTAREILLHPEPAWPAGDWLAEQIAKELLTRGEPLEVSGQAGA